MGLMGLPLQRIISRSAPRSAATIATAIIFGVLHVALVVGGYLLDDVTIAVVAGDVDGGVRQFVLDVGRGGEDDSSASDE